MPDPDRENSMGAASFAERIASVQALLQARELQFAFITSPEMIFFLTGHESTGYYLPHLLVVPPSGQPVFIARDFELPLPAETAALVQTRCWNGSRSFAEVCRAFLDEKAGGAARSGIEGGSNFFTHRTRQVIERSADTALVDIGGALEALKRSKNPWELSQIRRAGKTVVHALDAGLQALEPGRTEKEIAALILQDMLSAGADFPVSIPYVYFGERTKLAMRQPGADALRAGDALYIECGARVAGYNAAITRTGSYGKAPRPIAELHGHARRAFEIMLAAMKPGVPAKHIDEAARRYLRQNDLEQHWKHRGGYSIGIAFAPGWGEGEVLDISPHCEAHVPPGAVFHLVSLLKSPETGYVGLSETVTVTESGAETLTPYSRDILQLST